MMTFYSKKPCQHNVTTDVVPSGYPPPPPPPPPPPSPPTPQLHPPVPLTLIGNYKISTKSGDFLY